MVLLTVWIPVAVPFLFGNVNFRKLREGFTGTLEQYTGKLKDFFGGFEVIQMFSDWKRKRKRCLEVV